MPQSRSLSNGRFNAALTTSESGLNQWNRPAVVRWREGFVALVDDGAPHHAPMVVPRADPPAV